MYRCVLLQDVNKNGSTHDGGIWTMSESQQVCPAKGISSLPQRRAIAAEERKTKKKTHSQIK